MKVNFAYLGRSQMIDSSSGSERTLSMLPNLTREKVSFDAPLRHPLRFREAMSALHDVVINDLRFKPRDKTAYEEWQKEQAATRRSIYNRELDRATKDLAVHRGLTPPPAGFQALFEKTRKRYWDARFQLARLLQRDNPELWRWLMPCDPVITVAHDVVFFECFSADESSYGCLTVSRDGFGHDSAVQLGTTNVDYSWDLYDHFQSLRSYRQTRFLIDPTGFEVKTAEEPAYREEKIDLPDGWLRGFMTTQEAMGMPGLTVSLSREAVYSALAFLKRHKAKASPRAVRFELLPGKPPIFLLEPWEQRIVSHGTVYDGPPTEPIRIWGARRLLVLARVLPLAERFDVLLLGTGLPSFWVARMGEMQLTVGLSGWTTNDWTRGSALDLLAPPAPITDDLLMSVGKLLQEQRSMTLSQLQTATEASAAAVTAALRRLAFAGQVIHDLPNGVYRFRQVMPMALSEAQLGAENAELTAARHLMLTRKSTLESSDRTERGAVLVGNVESTPVEVLVDLDGRIRRGKCQCGHFRKFGIRNGPCRHMIVLRYLATSTDANR
ncbi:MAG: hypothetical protein JWP89_4670 [Schlesneria sp.]|nr:hypothetical protein [Schlesneria sp.]